MPPRRDAFAHTLQTLRHRLRQGVDAPGAPLPINGIASELRLSPTPVREALSRLAGEGLIDKAGPNYLRPKLDGPTLSELYALRLIYLEAAQGLAARLKARATAASSVENLDLSAETLFARLVGRSADQTLLAAYQRCADQLAPFWAVEVEIVDDGIEDIARLAEAEGASDTGQLKVLLRRYHRRRIAAAALIVREASDPKYRTPMI
ncbi:MAG: hypothetical protein BGN86_06000 [Caulobacterales bacterium 68-7]|nr:MAG: hypothetical protein BGN86_06000 [Caulobacterales bacterium 68-7]